MDLYRILLVIHVLGGSIAVLLGFCLILTKKGNKIHKKIGKIYFYTMLNTSIVAIPITTYLRPNLFLFLISIFSIYMLLTGIRYLKKKKI